MRAARVRLVLVHGSRLASSQWAPVQAVLERVVGVSGVEVVTPDLPGHGARAGERFTLDRAVEVVQDAVAAAPRMPTVVVGHSLGGYVALAHAARHGGPDDGADGDLAGLVLADCSADPVGVGAAVYRGVAALTDRVGERRLGPLYDRVFRRLYPPEVAEPVLAGGWWFGATPDAWREVMARCRAEMLRDVRAPVMLLNGRWDQFRLGERSFTRVRPDAEVVLVPAAGHFSCLDQPEFFARAVADFASRC